MKLAIVIVVPLLSASFLLAQEAQPNSERAAVDKGLAWLVKQQRADGSFSNGGQHPIATTGLCGMAFLMEGSTPTEGKYAKPIRKAVEFLVKKSQRGKNEGLIGDPELPAETGRYMYGHGYALLFLASVYADEPDSARRRELKEVLTRAVKYSKDAQSTQGGWYYTSAKEGHDNDEASVTLCLIQGLQAAQFAGIAVPRDMLKKAQKCQREQVKTSELRGFGIWRGAPASADQPSAFAGIIVCAFAAGEYDLDQVKKCFKFCERRLPTRDFGGRFGFDVYTQLYWAQVMYALGEAGHEKLRPDAEERLRWSDYRARAFPAIIKTQKHDGSWDGPGGWGPGPMYVSAVNLTILQMENEAVPILASRMPLK